MVDREHIASLVKTAVSGPSGRAVSPDTAWHAVRFYPNGYDSEPFRVEHTTGEALGEILRAENVTSLRARYTDADETMIPEWAAEPFTWNYFDGRRLTTVEALSALDCYAYQACESVGWETSAAFKFCQAFRDHLIGTLDGYSWNVNYGPATVGAL